MKASSQHLTQPSARRSSSTEVLPSFIQNLKSNDPLQASLDKLPDLQRSFDDVDTANKKLRNPFTAYDTARTFREKKLEGAVTTAINLAAVAEQKLEDASQKYAEDLKAVKEAQTITLEAIHLECEKQRDEMAAQLNENTRLLELYDAFTIQIESQANNLCGLPVNALQKSEEVMSRWNVLTERLSSIVVKDWGVLTCGELKKAWKTIGKAQDMKNGMQKEMEEVWVILK